MSAVIISLLGGLTARGLQLLGCDEIGKNETQKQLAPFPRSASFISVRPGPGKASTAFHHTLHAGPAPNTRPDRSEILGKAANKPMAAGRVCG